MSFINKIPRGLRVLVVIAVLGILIWQFAVDTPYFYYSIGAAILITFGVIVLIYKPFKVSQSKKTARKSGNEAADAESPENSGDSQVIDTFEAETDNAGTRPNSRSQTDRITKGTAAKTVSENAIIYQKSAKATSKDNRSADSPLNQESVPEDDLPGDQPIGRESTEKKSFISKIPRGLRVLAVMAVLGILIWQFAVNNDYYYYAIGAAVLITFGVIVLVYKPFKFSQSQKATDKSGTEAANAESLENPGDSPVSDKIEIEADYTDSPSIMRNKPVTPFRSSTGKTAASDSSRNLRSTSRIRQEEALPLTKPIAKTPSSGKASKSENAIDTDKITTTGPVNEDGVPAIPLVEDETTLTEEDKNQLVNAVWYRCENPYCKYTSFLGVHHIVDEKDGGTNRLDNLIVLCPYCHDLAHRQEIPVEEMQDWIGNRENRFKVKPDWKYF